MLRTNSALGAQLDSLADVVSFGAVPTVMMITLFHGMLDWTLLAVFIEFGWRAYIFILPVYILLTAPALAAAYRLARFNIQQQSSALHYFEGLPTPASGLLVAGCCIMAVSVFPEKQLYNPEVHGMPVLLGFFCTLAMVSRWPFLSFKGSTRERLALVAVFATGALVAWLTDWQPWVVLATLALYAVVSRVLITPVRRAAQ
jgi:CDP-diacylglycerol--serine O-phosphatidyltransferase